MNLREKLAVRSRPFLEPDDEPRYIFMAQTGVNPALAVVVGVGILTFVGSDSDFYVGFVLLSLLLLPFFFLVKYRVVAVTDRAIVVLRARKFLPSKPNAVVARLPRATVLGAVAGLWVQVKVGDEKMWVHPRFKRDLRAADAAIGASKPPSPPARQ